MMTTEMKTRNEMNDTELNQVNGGRNDRWRREYTPELEAKLAALFGESALPVETPAQLDD